MKTHWSIIAKGSYHVQATPLNLVKKLYCGRESERKKTEVTKC